MLKNKVLFLGLGNCGCKISKIFGDKGYATMYVNGSEQDLKILGGSAENIYRLKGFDGFGGHRERAIDCISQNMEFIDELRNIKQEIIFVVFGAGGSTGSGISTVAAEILIKAKKIVCMVPVLPYKHEPIIKHTNSYEVVVELQELEDTGATFFINNESSTEKNDFCFINKNFFETLDMYLTNNSYGNLNNFDESERLEMLKEHGAFVMSLNKATTTEFDIVDSLKKDGIFAPVETNYLCGHIGIIHKGSNESDIKLEKLITEFGKPLNSFEGYNAIHTLVAVSGLSYPVTYIKTLGELAQKSLEERRRGARTVNKLKSLDLSFDVQNEKQEKPIKKKSKLDLIKELNK